ncbi:3923_t:CDS:1, partial [Gigaspora margarita]
MPKKLSLNNAIKIAEFRGGKCLSREYINNGIPMLWNCIKGHEWSANFYNIKNGKRWCPTCSDTRLDISVAKELACNKNGECLSEKYINNKSPLLWRCSEGHEWYARLSSIKNNNSWCLNCTHRRPITLEIAKQIAYTRNGKCISEKYVNNQLPLLWCCKKGHLWKASLSNVKSGTWCPYCKNKHENLCRKIVSKYLGPPSEIRRPDFLKTSESPIGLELDIYYPEYGLAIEVQGEQHEKYIEFFHRGDPNNFIKQQERDQLKNELCEENWIVL